MIVLDTRIDDVTRDRDFGRVEALVTLLVKRAGRPSRPVTVRTNVPARGAEPLRRRLVLDAARLARHFAERTAPLDHAA